MTIHSDDIDRFPSNGNLATQSHVYVNFCTSYSIFESILKIALHKIIFSSI